ncbi:MAG TPA: PEP-CTERM sorting domain-containing protein [Bryobacteraceae bacterium]|jgi:hypothetical protein
MKKNFVRVLLFASTACALFAQAGDTSAVVTPEPGTVVLLVAGLGGLGFAAWRRSRKR